MDIAEVLAKHSNLPLERLRIARTLDELRLSDVRRGIVFIFAVWSAPAVVAFKRFTRVLREIDVAGLDLVVLDTDCLTSQAGISLWGSNVGGGGETLWIRDGIVVARLLLYLSDSERDTVRSTGALRDPPME